MKSRGKLLSLFFKLFRKRIDLPYLRKKGKGANVDDMLTRLKGRKFESSLPGFNYREELHEASQYLFGKAEKRKKGKQARR